MLEGKEVVIRAIIEGDLEVFFEWTLRYPTSSFLLDNKTDLTLKSLSQIRAEYKEKKSQGLINPLLYVIENRQGEPLGFLNIMILAGAERNGFFNLAAWEEQFFADPRLEEAGILLLNYIFYQRNLYKAYSRVIEYDQYYIDYLKKLGLEDEGKQRDQLFLNNTYYGVHNFAMLVEEYRQK
jgi:hypothetical protein